MNVAKAEAGQEPTLLVAGTTGPCQFATSVHASFKPVVTAIDKIM